MAATVKADRAPLMPFQQRLMEQNAARMLQFKGATSGIIALGGGC